MIRGIGRHGATRRGLLAGGAAAAALAVAARPAGAAATSLQDLAPAIDELLVESGVPSLNLAVLDGGGGVSTVAVGRRALAAPEEATTRTMYQAAAITKTVSAAITLVVAQNGVLDLDADVRGYLRRWRLPPSPMLDGGVPTLRRLLGMTAGIGVPGFAGYAADAPLPSLIDILEGRPPATSPPVTVVATPGSAWLYSSGGYEVLQAALEDVTRQSFRTLVGGLIQAPADMGYSVMAQPLPARYAAEAAIGHFADGTPLPGGARVLPELAATGLWSTAGDLARLARALSDSYRGRGLVLLDKARAREMFTPVDGLRYGCGGAVAGAGEALCFQKRGQTAGFQCYLVLYPATGQGAVAMTNGDRGNELAARLLPLLAVRYAWPEFPGIID